MPAVMVLVRIPGLEPAKINSNGPLGSVGRIAGDQLAAVFKSVPLPPTHVSCFVPSAVNGPTVKVFVAELLFVLNVYPGMTKVKFAAPEMLPIPADVSTIV